MYGLAMNEMDRPVSVKIAVRHPLGHERLQVSTV